jgi:hypothetical protein
MGDSEIRLKDATNAFAQRIHQLFRALRLIDYLVWFIPVWSQAHRPGCALKMATMTNVALELHQEGHVSGPEEALIVSAGSCMSYIWNIHDT